MAVIRYLKASNWCANSTVASSTHLPTDAPTNFVPRELRRALLKNDNGKLNRNAWEMGLALAIKDAFRSGDLYLPQSKHYVSFWDLMMNESQWKRAARCRLP